MNESRDVSCNGTSPARLVGWLFSPEEGGAPGTLRSQELVGRQGRAGGSGVRVLCNAWSLMAGESEPVTG